MDDGTGGEHGGKCVHVKSVDRGKGLGIEHSECPAEERG
jgi:hypothetical protein